MFMLEQILTKRKKSPSFNYDLIYEWEDVLSDKLDIPLVDENQLVYNKIVRVVPFLPQAIQTAKPSLVFDIYPTLIGRGGNKKNIIPVIVDFYHKDNGSLRKFYSSYSHNHVVLISSKEVYDFLKEHNCPLNIKHWGLSISDKYSLEESLKMEKDIDLILMGRPSRVLQAWAEKYAESHPDFVYAYRINKDGHWLCQNSRGDIVGNLDGRDGYMKTMQRAKCGLYNTPGIDGGESRTNGFNQVTPRFLEYIACGCHVISRYPQNSDVAYYELDQMTSNTETYEQFEKMMDYAVANPVDKEKYQKYLNKHVTSTRAKELMDILKTI